MKRFNDRADAGRSLTPLLEHLRGQNVIVLGLPRGVRVAYEVAHALNAPLDVLNVRKLGVPWHEELAMGAVATGGVRVLNDSKAAPSSRRRSVGSCRMSWTNSSA